MEKALLELVEGILTFSKYSRKGLTYEEQRLAMALMLFSCRYHRQPKNESERRKALFDFDQSILAQVEALKALPEELLEGVENFEAYCLGYLTQEQRTRLLAFYKKETGSPFQL